MNAIKTTCYLFILTLLFSCQATSKSGVKNQQQVNTINISEGNHNLEILLLNGNSFNHPSYAIWLETPEGEYIKTLYVTKAFASGEFGHAQLTDSTWSDKPGPSFQPATLPYWTHKKGKIDGVSLIPTPEHPYVDAYTSATPKQNVRFQTHEEMHSKSMVLLVEVNQTWDWNKFWTNNKYDNKHYQHSAQPSLIYSVRFKPTTQKTYYLNPIGHGHPSGANGELFTNLSSLSTAKEIFKTITLSVK